MNYSIWQRQLNSYFARVVITCSRRWWWNIFSKQALFISGLIFAQSFVEKGLIDILIVHLEVVWKHENLPKSAQVVNIQEGVSSVLQIFFAFVTHAYIGRFRMVICSCMLYILGLSLFWIASWYLTSIEIKIFYLALVIVVLAQAAKEVSLKAFLDDQFLRAPKEMPFPVTEEDEERAYICSNVWRCFATILGVTAAAFCNSYVESWKVLCMISAVAFVVGFMWFLIGTPFYICNKPTSPDVSWLRWLDKAASINVTKKGHPPGKLISQVKEVKFLLRMVPMWITFIVYGLVYATGKSFFLIQATNIDENAPVVIFSNLQTLTRFIIEYLSGILCKKLGRTMNGQLIVHGIIGLGMVFSFLCTINAWMVAAHNRHHWDSVSILIPQFVLLGIMRGLCEYGHCSFFDSQVCKSLREYGPYFGEFVMGIGKFVSALCIFICSSWFKADIDSSRLDKYYALLAIVSFINLLLNLLVSFWYGDDQFLPEEADIENGRPVQIPSQDNLPDQTHKNYPSENSLLKKLFTIPADRFTSKGKNKLVEDSTALLNKEDSLQVANDDDEGTTEKEYANHQPNDNATPSFSDLKASGALRLRTHSMK